MGLLTKFFNNTRKPQGFLGRLMVLGMNSGAHAAMSKWALSNLSIQEDWHILDIGCGGGANIARLLHHVPKGSVWGIDYSSVSVSKSAKVNAKAIAEGRSKVMEGDVSHLSFENDSFDLVTAFETIYFWPDIEHCFKEVWNVMRPGAVFAIINESDGTSEDDVKWESIVSGMHTYTAEEISSPLQAAGFSNISINRDVNRHWLMVTARKL